MTTFAENNIVFPDGQLNVAPLPEALMRNGFTPETRDAPGMPLPAQYLNWLFRDVYRNQQANVDATNNALKKDANLSDVIDRQEALKNLGLLEGLLAPTGWRREPSGLLIQWGAGMPTNGQCVVTFPVAFTGRPFTVTFGYRESQYPTYAQSIVIDDRTLNTTGFTCRAMNATSPVTNSASAFFWRAEGI